MIIAEVVAGIFVLMFSVAILVAVVAVIVFITRWLFRIDDIVQRLDVLAEHIEVGNRQQAERFELLESRRGNP